MRAATLLLLISPAVAGLTFHSPLFTDGMLLQRGKGTMVWGSGADALTAIKVSLTPVDGNPIVAMAKSNAGGNWSVTLPTIAAAKSATLNASDGGSFASLKNIAIGDLILCGGQSNSELTELQIPCLTFAIVLRSGLWNVWLNIQGRNAAASP
jgi:sialate O-acetylesterase